MCIRPPAEKCNLPDFTAYAKIAEAGYRSAMKALADWDDLQQAGHACAIAGSASPNSAAASPHETLAELDAALAYLEGP